MSIYQEVSDQYIMGAGGAVGLNILAIDWAMDMLGVVDTEKLDFSREVRTIASTILNEKHKKAEAEAKRKK